MGLVKEKRMKQSIVRTGVCIFFHPMALPLICDLAFLPNSIIYSCFTAFLNVAPHFYFLIVFLWYFREVWGLSDVKNI